MDRTNRSRFPLLLARGRARWLRSLAGVLAAGLVLACDSGSKPSCSDDDDDCNTAGGGLKDLDAGPIKLRDSAVDGGDGGVKLGELSELYMPCDVQAIVEARCGTCHGKEPLFGAPMPLATARDFQVASDSKRVMYALASERVKQPDKTKVMPPLNSEQLSAAELATLTGWLDRGAPGESRDCSRPPNDAGVPPGDGGVQTGADGLTCYKLLAHAGDNKTPYPVGIALDSYVTFIFAPPWRETSYGMLIRPVIDNAKALHHWLLFQDNVPGVPSPAIPEIGAHPTGQLLAVWAPGAVPMDLRATGKDVGLELPASTTYTVELHYNSSDLNAVDRSGVEVCVADKKPANIAAYSWLGYDNVGIPLTQWQGTCRPFSFAPIHIVSFMPHMHLVGRHMKAIINRADGSKEVVHDRDFDFNYQINYPVDLTLNPGDTLTTVCDYSQPAVFGQPTNLEMCYLFSMAYPKGALASPDIWGTVAHGSSSCLGQ